MRDVYSNHVAYFRIMPVKSVDIGMAQGVRHDLDEDLSSLQRVDVLEGTNVWRPIDAWLNCCYVASCSDLLLRCLNLEIMSLTKTDRAVLARWCAPNA
jgi:hypothetical protein